MNAFVTLLATDAYAPGVLTLGHALRYYETTKYLAVLCTPAIPPTTIARLRDVYDHVIIVDALDSRSERNLRLLGRPELGITLTKLQLWRQTQYSKVVFLDADVLPLRNVDELFEREELSAAPDAGWPDCFNSGVFVAKPSEATFEALIELAATEGTFDGGDQGLLNTYFSSWSKDFSRHLPFTYNTTPTIAYSYAPAYRNYGHDIAIVHFIGADKPWHWLRFGDGRLFPRGNASASFIGLVQEWWIVWERHYGQSPPHRIIQTIPPPPAYDGAELFNLGPMHNLWDTPDIVGAIQQQKLHIQEMPESDKPTPFQAEATWASVLPLEEHDKKDGKAPVEAEPHKLPPRHHEPSTPEYPMINWDPSYEPPPSTNAHVSMPDWIHFRNAWDMPFDRRATFVPPPVHYLPEVDRGEIRTVFPWEEHKGGRVVTRVWLDEEEAVRRRDEKAMRAAAEVAVGVAAAVGWRDPKKEPQKEHSFISVWDEMPGIQKYLAKVRGDEHQAARAHEVINYDHEDEDRDSGDQWFANPRWEGELVETDISELDEADLYDTSENEQEEVEIDEDDDYEQVSVPMTPRGKRSPLPSGIVPYTPGVSDEEWDDSDLTDKVKKVVRKKKLIKPTITHENQVAGGGDTASKTSSNNSRRRHPASRSRSKRAMYASATSAWFGQTPYTSAAATPTGALSRSGAQTPHSAPGSPTRDPVNEFRNYKIGWASDLVPVGVRSRSRSRSRSLTRSRSKSIEGVRRRAPSSRGSSRAASRQASRETSPSSLWKKKLIKMPTASRSTWDPHGALKGLQESGERLLKRTGRAKQDEYEEDEYQDVWVGVEKEGKGGARQPGAYYDEDEEDEDLSLLSLRFPGKKLRAMSPKLPKSPSTLPWDNNSEIEEKTPHIPASTIRMLKNDLSFLGMRLPTQVVPETAAALVGAVDVVMAGSETSAFEKAQEVPGDVPENLSLARGRLFRRRSSVSLKDMVEFEEDTTGSSPVAIGALSDESDFSMVEKEINSMSTDEDEGRIVSKRVTITSTIAEAESEKVMIAGSGKMEEEDVQAGSTEIVSTKIIEQVEKDGHYSITAAEAEEDGDPENGSNYSVSSIELEEEEEEEVKVTVEDDHFYTEDIELGEEETVVDTEVEFDVESVVLEED